MDNLTKVRIELLDEVTGEPIKEVDAITSSETIIYSNSNKTLVDFGSIKSGTSFNKTPLKEILDGVLYPYKEPEILEIHITNKDVIGAILKDIEIFKEKGTIIDSFDYIATIKNGTSSNISYILKIYKNNGEVEQQTGNIPHAEYGSEYSFTFTIPTINNTSTIELIVSDGTSNISAPYIKYIFVDPIFVGFIKDELAIENIDKELLEDYFDGIIKSNTDFLQKRIINPSDVYAYNTSLDYDHQKEMNPCLLVPNTWGNTLGILDMNNLNITRSYYIFRINLNIRDTEVLNYILYVSKSTFNTNNTFLSGIRYIFKENNYSVFPKLSELPKGVPLVSSFEPEDSFPIDGRFVVDKYEDLLNIKHPYRGLLTYVTNIDTYFRYQNNNWLPTSTRVYVIENADTLLESFGGWDDVAIETNGNVYRKRYNNVWELWGTIAGTGGGSGGDCNCQKYRFNEIYDPEKQYFNNTSFVDLVYHKGSTFFCKRNVIGIEPPGDGTYWSYFCRGFESTVAPKGLNFINSETKETVKESSVVLKSSTDGFIIPLESAAIQGNGGDENNE